MAPACTDILDLLDDCARVTREFYPSISVACLQLHYHVIPFLPLESRLSQVYGPKLQSGINIIEGRQQTWSPCIRTLEGHGNQCLSVPFSPDGGQLASGSHDRTVRLWNVSTGALLQVMIGHSHIVHSVTYSPDGTLIASGSGDKTVRIWDAKNGSEVGVYTEHSAPVKHVVFSADSRRIASGRGTTE